MISKTKLYFAKARPEAILPTKRESDAGYDLYCCVKEDEIEITPNRIKMIPTGIHSAFDSNYCMLVEERSSSGSKGLSKRCGVVDSSYRGEINVLINNTTNKTIIISRYPDKTKAELQEGMTDSNYVDNNFTIYPMDKGIAQAVMVVVPQLQTEEISLDELKAIPSERGEGKMGSSGK